MEHEHSPKVIEWGFDEDRNWIPSNYGCTECDETFVVVPLGRERLEHSHTKYVEGCFGCKLPTLQLNAGDAHSGRQVSQKKWDAETDAFDRAQAQGINPSGVSLKEIQDAHDASARMGVAYDGDIMMDAHKITKNVTDIMKEIDII